MKTMKTCFALMGAATLLTASNVFATIDGTITFTGGGYGNSAGGGAFAATTTGAIPGSFYTFCLEANETLTIPGSYNYTINTGAVNGGIGHGTTPGASATFDPLSIGTAYLYSQFRSGSLAGYNTVAGANNLQWAIWYLENEVGNLSDPVNAPVSATTYLNTALAGLNALGTYGSFTTYADLFQNANGAFGVVALNVTDGGQFTNGRQGLHQDVLGIVPEPSTVVAGALLLLPFGVSTLRILRKKQVS